MANNRGSLMPVHNPTIFKVAILCALLVESEAVEGILDEVYETKSVFWQRLNGDQNAYTLGRIGNNHVVLCYMPCMGKTRAASAASALQVTFPGIKLAIIAGVCGGAPQTPDKEDIFLGDIVISTKLIHGDFGRDYPDGIALKPAEEGGSRSSPPAIASFLHQAQTRHSKRLLVENTRHSIQDLLVYVEGTCPTTETDVLYASDYIHKHHQDLHRLSCGACSSNIQTSCDKARDATCRQLQCDPSAQIRHRARSVSTGPSIHFGAIATMDTVKKNGISRDRYVSDHKVLAFEMEAAGVWEIFPTIIIKGVCDYADSHKNKTWQQYAAVTAAACCKALLQQWRALSHEIVTLEEDSCLRDWKTQETADDKQTRELYLASLDFEQLDSRHHDIRIAYPETCDWVFCSPEFQSWLNPREIHSHHRIMWVKGKPGSGKSTLMKHIHGRCQQHFPGFLILTYFFHGRGTELQRTKAGMLRSFLYQLVKQSDEVWGKFRTAFPSRDRAVINRKWSADALENFLLLCSRSGWLSNCVFLIDALDEGGEDTARELATFCGDLSLNAINQSSQLFMCLSIRHFPNIGMKHCVPLDVDSKLEHDKDIQRYVFDNILEKDPNLINRIIQKARHVFLWAVIVVRILNQLYDRGSSLHVMHQNLTVIPDNLHAIFTDLIHADGGLTWKGILMFQLVLSALRPLCPHTLYLLVLSGCEEREVSRETSDRLELTESYYASCVSVRLKNSITTESRGLLEIARNPATSTTHIVVQVIHESVRDFLLQSDDVPWLARQESVGSSHKLIAQCSVRSLSAGSDANYYQWESLPPDTRYALKFLPFHVEQAIFSDQDFVKFIREWSDALESYVRCYGALGSRAISLPTQWYNWADISKADLLIHAIITMNGTVLSERAVPLLRRVLRFWNILDYRIGYGPLFYAVSLNWLTVFEILLDAGANVLVANRKGQNLFYQVFLKLTEIPTSEIFKIRRATWRSIRFADLVVVAYSKSGYNVNGTCEGLPPLIIAVQCASSELVRNLLRAGAAPNIDCNGITALDEALACCAANPDLLANFRDIIFILLEYNATSSDFVSAARDLFHRLAHGDLDLMSVLVGRASWQGEESCLGLAVGKGFYGIAELLLKAGLDPNYIAPHSDGYMASFLHAAVLSGDVSMVSLLLEYGADPSAQDPQGYTALEHAILVGNQQAIDILSPLTELEYPAWHRSGWIHVEGPFGL